MSAVSTTMQLLIVELSVYITPYYHYIVRYLTRKLSYISIQNE